MELTLFVLHEFLGYIYNKSSKSGGSIWSKNMGTVYE